MRPEYLFSLSNRHTSFPSNENQIHETQVQYQRIYKQFIKKTKSTMIVLISIHFDEINSVAFNVECQESIQHFFNLNDILLQEILTNKCRSI